RRPATERLRRLTSDQTDTLTALLQPGTERLHAEDIEQLMGRVTLFGENQPGKRSFAMGLNVLRTTRDVDWVKLRDWCGPKMKQHHWRGGAHLDLPIPDPLLTL